VTGQDEKRFAVKPIEPLLTKRCWLLFFFTTSEKESGFLLIETFRKLFNAQNDGHLDQLRVAIYYLSGSVRMPGNSVLLPEVYLF
jgi:hypothetical protein